MVIWGRTGCILLVMNVSFTRLVIKLDFPVPSSPQTHIRTMGCHISHIPKDASERFYAIWSSRPSLSQKAWGMRISRDHTCDHDDCPLSHLIHIHEWNEKSVNVCRTHRSRNLTKEPLTMRFRAIAKWKQFCKQWFPGRNNLPLSISVSSHTAMSSSRLSHTMKKHEKHKNNVSDWIICGAVDKLLRVYYILSLSFINYTRSYADSDRSSNYIVYCSFLDLV